MVNKFLNYLKFDGVVIFVNNHHKKEISFSHLLKLKNIETICVYKTEPLYKVNQKKLVLNKLLFFLFIFFSIFKKKNNTILIFSQPIYSLPYIFLGNIINIYFYDVHIGLEYASKIKLFLEKFTLFFYKKIIHRDLRLWVEYKKILKNKNRKNLLIPDFIIKNSFDNIKKINNPIKCAVIGWVDDKFVRVDESVQKLASLGVNVYFFTSKESFNSTIKNINLDKFKLNNIHYVGYLEKDEDLKKYLSDFLIGICPHDAKNPKISKNYRKYCSSMRIINYIENYLTIFLSKKTFFQKLILRKYNSNFYDIDILKSLKSIEEIKKILYFKEIRHDNSIFNKKKLSENLIKFF